MSQIFRSRICSGRGLLAEPAQDGLERLADDGFGEGARGVVRAGAAAFVGGLEDEAAAGHGRGRGWRSIFLLERGEQVVGGGGGLERFVALRR